MDRYKYSVTPFSPIKELIPGKSIRAPFSADLTKDEVFMCMKHGPVYRLFPGKDPIKVTGSNFESLHKSKFEEEEDKPVAIKQDVKVEELAPVVEEIKEEVQASVEEDVKIFDREELRETVAMESAPVEESVVEEAPVKEVVSTPEYNENEFVNDGLDNEAEEESEEVEEESVEEETQSEDQNSGSHKYNPQFKPNYNKKNKKHKNH